tara:strand:- start:15179 stop:15445 length:267 start_codon:yes stop_codon:yes gene_type:complete
MINNENQTPKRRGPNYKNYHYKLVNNDTTKYYKTLKDITAEHNISRGNIYLMLKDPEKKRRKYNHLQIEKCHLHYLVVEQGIDPNLIR